MALTPTSSTRPKPYTIEGKELNADQIKQIDEMFDLLFTDLGLSSSAKFVIQVVDASLPNAQALSALSTGYVKVTTGTGLLSSQTVPIPATDGGTGLTLYAIGDLLYASTTTVLSRLAAVTAGKLLRAAGVSTAPAYSTFTIPDTFAAGDIIYASAANVLTALAKNTSASRYLSNTGASNIPAWAQINLADGVTGDLPYANLTPATAASKLLGRGDASAGDWQEITIGTGLAMTGTTLSSTGGGGSGEPTEETTTSTGTVNNYDLDAAYTLLRCNNATDLTLTGFTCIAAAPTAGDRVLIVSVGAGDVYLAHQDTGSTAANRLFNTVTSGHTPLAAGKGSAMYQYDGTTSRWRLVAHTQGAPILVPFNAGDYTANGAMTWAGNNGDPSWFDYKYSVIGSIIFISVSFDAGDIGGTPNIQLQLKMPLTYSPAGIGANFCFIKNAGTKENGRFLAAPGSSNINITKIDQSNFTTQTDTLQIFGELFIPLT